MKKFRKGLKSGVPIGLGYLSVSFTFGILAVSYGFSWWQAVLISMTTLTSAGQLAGIEIMILPNRYVEMLVSQLTINIRYSFMSVSLSQKTSDEFRGIKRWLLAFFMTDEIFALASNQDEVDSRYFLGLSIAPFFGWTFGTFFGSVLGNILPENIMNAMCIAMYGMFVAIVAPVAKNSKSLLSVVALSIFLSCSFNYLPLLSSVSRGLSISICAVSAAVFGAVLFPIKEAENG